MESLQGLKSRIRAVGNVKEIAKAMEVVAATKMRKSQEIALATRPFSYAALNILAKISKSSGVNVFFPEKKEGERLIVVIASDRGFAGKFNVEVLNRAEKLLNGNKNVKIAAVGKKANLYFKRKKYNVVKSFYGFGDFVSHVEILPLFNFIMQGYDSGLWSSVSIISTHFRTALLQEVISREFLPVDFEKIKEAILEIIPEHGKFAEHRGDFKGENGLAQTEYIIEPSPKELILMLMPYLLKIQLYDIILEANASEHSARRVAMKNASDNASELLDGLVISFNKSRQANITNELIEITATRSALG